MATPKGKSEVLQGTLDLMVLKTLDALGPQHGYGVARRIEQISDDLLRLNEGTVYASLLRLAEKGWIQSAWGASDRNRRRSSIRSPGPDANSWLGRRRPGNGSRA